VVGTGENYANAYFEIKYLRAYTTGGVGPTPVPAVPGATLGHNAIGQTANAAAPRRMVDPSLGGTATWRTLAMGAMVVFGAGWGAGMGMGWMDGVGW
jgi:hypothetical protein